jgi:GTPase SAR1 family protein
MNKSTLMVKDDIAREKLKYTFNFFEYFKKGNCLPNDIIQKLKYSLNLAMQCTHSYKYKIIITGLVNCGKTTFINSLIGKFILPTGAVENTKWPIIIRNSDSDVPKLYSSKIDNNSLLYEFEEDKLLAEGNEKVMEYLNYLNKSYELEDKYRYLFKCQSEASGIAKNTNSKSFSKNKNQHSQFVFILKLNISAQNQTITDYGTNNTASTTLSLESSNIHDNLTNFELWDLPGLNSASNLLVEDILNKIIESEMILDKTFSAISFKRLKMVYIMDYSFHNQPCNLELWHNTEQLRNLCQKVFLVVNKFDVKDKDGSNFQQRSQAYKFLKLWFNNSDQNINYYFLSSLYSYLENCENNNKLDFFYWKLKEKLFEACHQLKKSYKNFDEFKKATFTRLEKESIFQNCFDYLEDFNKFMQDFNSSLLLNNFTELLLNNPTEIVKNIIFENNNRRKNAKNFNIANPLKKCFENLNNEFKRFLTSFKREVKTTLTITKFKLNKVLHDSRFKLRQYYDNLTIIKNENFNDITEIYKKILVQFYQIKTEAKLYIQKKLDTLTRILTKELIDIGLKRHIIQFYCAKLKIDFENEFQINDNLIKFEGNSLLENIGLSVTDGVVKGVGAFFGTGLIFNLFQIPLLAPFSYGLIGGSIGLGFFIYYTFIQMEDLNSFNRDYVLERNSEIWNYIEKYNTYVNEALNYLVNKTIHEVNVLRDDLSVLFNCLRNTL